MSTFAKVFRISCLTVIMYTTASLINADEARIVVKEDVLVPAAQMNPIGTMGVGKQGRLVFGRGNLIMESGFEPSETRELRRVIAAGKDEQDRPYVQLDKCNTTTYATLASGAFSGVPFRAYRMVDSEGKPLPLKEGKTGIYADTSNAAEIISLGTYQIPPRGAEGFPDGGWVAPSPADYNEYRKNKQEWIDKGRLYYTGGVELRVDDVIMYGKRFLNPDPRDLHPRFRNEKKLKSLNTWGVTGGKAIKKAHKGSLPQGMDGGESYVAITASGGEEVVMRQTTFGGSDPQKNKAFHWYGQLEPGLTYIYKAWMRQEGLGAEGSVKLTFSSGKDDSYFGQDIAETFTVSGGWKLYSFTFQAPERPEGKQNLYGPAVVFTGPGTLCLDNIKLEPVYDEGDEDKPFVINKRILKTLVDSQPEQGHKGHLRTWSAMNEKSMMADLRWDGGGPKSSALVRDLTLLEATGESAETRMVPWINLQITHSEEEYRGLIEYLAAPFDPSKDNSTNKPYAALRVSQRGHNRPWTDTFRKIIIEFGNENWHNRAVESWVGFGRFKAVHSYGKDYGLWCRYMIKEIKKSPYMTSDIAEKISFGVGGNYSADIEEGKVHGYGPEATAACRIHTYETHANYVGPKWELKEKLADTLSDKNYQLYLVAGYQLRGKLDKYTEVLALNNKNAGTHVRIAGYEGGPSGYDTGNKDYFHPQEQIGHSKVSAVAAADAWFYSWTKGWLWQTMITFGAGTRWDLFEVTPEGFNPRPAWIAMSMINRVMKGDMLTVETESTPEFPIEVITRKAKGKRKAQTETKNIPVLGAYAKRNEGTLSVIVLNRSLEKTQNAALVLPVDSVSRITRHFLSGGPKDLNFKSMAVDWKQEDVPAEKFSEGTLKIEVEPGGFYIYEFKTGNAKTAAAE